VLQPLLVIILLQLILDLFGLLYSFKLILKLIQFSLTKLIWILLFASDMKNKLQQMVLALLQLKQHLQEVEMKNYFLQQELYMHKHLMLKMLTLYLNSILSMKSSKLLVLYKTL
jgi:hypothetical protein